MTVSVIIATYRRDSSLRRAIESVLAQTYSDIELIVIDDNADAEWNERVSEIVRGYGIKGYVRNDNNRGSAETRNIGVRAASGEYVTFLDDDDVYLPEKIEKQLGDMLDKDADFSITDLLLYDEREKLVDKRIRTYLTDFSRDALIKSHMMHNLTGTDTIMFKRDYILKVGCFGDIDVGDEFYLMLRAIEGGGRMTYLPRCDVKAYVHEEGGLSSGDEKEKGENLVYEHKKKYFHLFDKKSIRYIVVRHYMVLTLAAIRKRSFVLAFKYMCKCFFTSPVACISVIIER